MSPPLAPELLQAVVVVTAALVLGMIVALLVQRAVRRRRERRSAALDARYRRLVLESTIAEDDEVPALLERVRGLDDAAREHVGRMVFLMLRGVTGEAADRLRAVAVATGLAPRVLADARHRSAVRRADAAEALGRLAPEGALALLLELADDPDPTVRTVAVRALGGFEAPEAVGAAIDALASDSGVPSTVGASVLLQQGSTAGDRVRLALHDRDPAVRRGAARIAGLLQVPGCGDSLAALVRDEHESVRLAAMRSLERLPVRAALPALVDAALRGGIEGEAAARAVASMPTTWTAAALEALAAGEPGVRRAAGLRRPEAVA
ncbi:HEAT repeat domain-containing protein [Agrococcus sp. HG114]|uniref:HEAT repeat domain-containing protein n=1 Tax=Agrococcus sp. HG114 TaxID=2969757 RepID=UPI00215A6C1D|nr:HEAT repeat domain-containing protein [Agrococcus sp. HG114]MCR8670383.1 HEAT repeat domain-containing protein [Agrococcus sp. HG114]